MQPQTYAHANNASIAANIASNNVGYRNKPGGLVLQNSANEFPNGNNYKGKNFYGYLNLNLPINELNTQF